MDYATRRGGIILGSTLALGLGVTACGANASASSPTSSANKPRVVDITYWAGHASGALHKAVVHEVAQFNQTHPDIHVTFRAIGASHHGLAAFEAGRAPNVAMVSGYIVPQLAQAGAILPLGPYVHGKTGLTPSEIHQWFYPVVWKDTSWPNGTQYVMPLEKKSLLVIYYNESLFKQAGITQPPTTWNDVGQDALKITKLGQGYHGIAWTPSLRQFFDIVSSNGGKVFATATRRRAFALDNAGAQSALTMLHGWIQNGSLIPTTGYQYQLDFGTGKVGMLIDASAGYTYDKGSVGGKFVMGGIPAPKGSTGHSSQYINGASTVLFNVGSSSQKSAAWTFMKWLASPTTNVYWDEHTNYLPLGPEGYHLMTSFYQAHPAERASYSNPQDWWFKPRTPNFEAAKTAMAKPFDQALHGTLAIPSALATMSSVGTSYLSGKVRG